MLDHNFILLCINGQFNTSASLLEAELICLQNWFVHVVSIWQAGWVNVIFIKWQIHILIDLWFRGLHKAVLLTEDIVTKVMETQILNLFWNLFSLPIIDRKCFYQLQTLILTLLCLHIFGEELLKLNCWHQRLSLTF